MSTSLAGKAVQAPPIVHRGSPQHCQRAESRASGEDP